MKHRKRLALLIAFCLVLSTCFGLTPMKAKADYEVQVYTVYTWGDLQDKIIHNAVGDTIKLGGDITAGENESALILEAKDRAEIDLNGHTLSRGLSGKPAVENGSVFINRGALIITGTGTITGGNTTGNGGAICNRGTVWLEGGEISGNSAVNGGGIWTGERDSGQAAIYFKGGTITDNTASGNGGGVWVGDESGCLYMTGGSIQTNRVTGADSQGGGVYLFSGVMEVEKNPVIEGNLDAGNNANDVYLGNTTITIFDGFAETARIGIKAEPGTTITNNNYYYSFAVSTFFADDENYTIVKRNANAILVNKWTVTFDSGDAAATGTMESAQLADGEEYELPACGFTLEGKLFKGWSVKVGEAEAVEMGPEKKFTVSGDVTVTAMWTDPESLTAKDASWGHGEPYAYWNRGETDCTYKVTAVCEKNMTTCEEIEPYSYSSHSNVITSITHHAFRS